MKDSQVHQALINVYRQSNYHIFAEPEFDLKIDKRSAELISLYQKHNAEQAVFISACNPRSEPIAETENEARNAALLADIRQLQFAVYEAEGSDPKGIWPSEKSFLVPGMPAEVGSELGLKYGQNAILSCQPDGLVTLMLLR